jgi:hypothetical protein
MDEKMNKQCKNCNQIFEVNNKNKRQYNKQFCCKKCSSTYNGKNNVGRKRSIEFKNRFITETKICSMCKIEKDKNQFHKRNGRINGVQSKCKDCIYKYNQSRKVAPLKKGEKVCTKCSIKQNINHFFAGACTKDGRSSECKKCCNIRKLNYLHNNIEKRITENCRGRIRKAITKGYKSAATLKLLGCSIQELKKYLELKFSEGMSWNNYGEWHIDHIRPCCSFDLTKSDEQEKCFNYTNLQPLWAEDNLKKADRLDYKND